MDSGPRVISPPINAREYCLASTLKPDMNPASQSGLFSGSVNDNVIQRGSAPDPSHVSTYVYLARLAAQGGDAARARELLAEGLARHPGDAALQSALDELGQ